MSPHSEATLPPVERLLWKSTTVILATHGLAVFSLFYFSWEAVLAFAIAHYLFAGWGIALGLHRYFSHAAFRTSATLRGLLGYLATMNLQGGPIFWASIHRTHHLKSDEYGDAHSATRGFLWSHILWAFYTTPNGYNHLRSRTLTRDLSKSKWLRFLDRNALGVYLATAFVTLLIFRRWDVVLWAFPLRTVVAWHSTWLLNSYCHGARLSGPPAGLRNSFLCTLLTYGEGWHRNHHDRPDSASIQFRWWQIDPTYWHIRALELLGLAEINKKTRSGPRLGPDMRGRKRRRASRFTKASEANVA